MSFEREPESEMIMQDADSVSGFTDAGDLRGPLSPIYHFGCHVLSRMIPENGLVVDIGCGPAQFLTRLLQYRPDLTAIGTDLSDRMLANARKLASDRDVVSRIQFVQADFSQVDVAIRRDVDAVICMSALHHCPDFDCLVSALSAIGRLSQRKSGAIWLFDLVRPDSRELCELIPRTHEVAARERLPESFKQDWQNSLLAGWTVNEFQEGLRHADLTLRSVSANYSQLHWSGSLSAGDLKLVNNTVFGSTGDDRAARLASSLGFDFPEVPKISSSK
ncbi:class I SAM-dependent methyltransferase [Stieleria varia]|uniref:Methyltransferase domain-containing protein n=1 Tax=Stieleria varia TaxID=2528005 RepID=A0A5C6B3B8_9BACT|nr:class I SAM-dependent methyltransferase [Stieleria varia]TWU04994.1 hypothetical protein Pla52n_30390 [Stieleria varia]